jgi:class II flagellar assembly regulator FliX
LRDPSHAHLRTERHHDWNAHQQHEADLLRAALAPKATANIDALLALQGVEEDPAERRKRSVQRGKGALDVLDDLKLRLLSGNLDSSMISRLRDAAANLKSSSGDPRLDAVLSEIELRVEVELAKAAHY